MSIESSAVPSSHKPTGNPASHGARASTRPASGADAAPDTGAGFRAILGVQDEAPADASVSATPKPPPIPTATCEPVAAALDASSLLQNNPQMAAAQATAAQAQQAAAEAIGAQAAAAQDPALLAQAALLLAAGNAAAPAVAASPASPLPPAMAAAQAARAPAAAARVAPAGAATREVAPAAAPLAAGLQQASARALAGREAGQARAESGAVDSSGELASSELASARADANKFLAALEQAKAVPSARSPEPVLAPLLARAEKPQAERSAVRQEKTEPTYGSATLGVGAADFSQSGTPAPVLAPPPLQVAEQVAEQVSYWVSQNVQNAELSLDGLGLLPVEVSISMQGKEAHISFRTDEAATRDVLQSAGAQLKDLLQGEGLVLAGVSVGTSGSGQTDGGERRGRPALRQTAIAPLQGAGAERAPRPRSASLGGAGRSVDLFV